MNLVIRGSRIAPRHPYSAILGQSLKYPFFSYIAPNTTTSSPALTSLHSQERLHSCIGAARHFTSLHFISHFHAVPCVLSCHATLWSLQLIATNTTRWRGTRLCYRLTLYSPKTSRSANQFHNRSESTTSKHFYHSTLPGGNAHCTNVLFL